jgi:uncharacterized repeat protein (TIGR02543 family)
MRFFRKIMGSLLFMTTVLMVSSCGQGLLETTNVNEKGPSTVIFSSQFKDTLREVTPPSFTSKTVNYGNALGALPTDPAMTGYQFGGWYTQRDGYGVNVTENTKIYQDTTAYAYWYNYKVTFMNDGTLYARRGVTLPEKTVRTMPTPPTKTGYKFAGWYDAGGHEFIASTEVTADKTVYARWATAEVYAVTYDSEEGSAVGVQYVVSPDATIGALPTDPVRLFYAFGGWWTGRNGGGTQFTASTTVTSNITVYAKWTADPGYTVTYNSYGGTPVDKQYVILSSGNTVATGTKEGDLPAAPEKACYDFAGWFTEPEGTTEFTKDTEVSDDITIYAKWTWHPLPAPATYAIGDRGPSCVGKIFFIEQAEDGTYGWEMAPPDWYLTPDNPSQSTDPYAAWIEGTEVDEWDNYLIQSVLNGNTSTLFGTGMNNSNAIIAQEGHTRSAAKMCRDYRGGGFDDWFLPSQEELAVMFTNKDVKRSGGFYDANDEGYWSSSEYGANDGWSQYFISGKQTGTRKGQQRLVRPIRRFKIS